MGIEERIKRLQQRLGLPVDGMLGPVTLTRLEALVDQVLGKAPTPAEYNLECSRVGLDLKTVIDQMREQVQNVE